VLEPERHAVTKLTVLMYHAIGGSDIEEGSADPHYTVSRTTFGSHLAMIRAAGRSAFSVARLLATGDARNVVAVTFDDGHASNAAAAQDILEQGGSADLFVNPAKVGQPHFLDWPDLRDLAKAGISIQSHGHTHRYFNELSDQEVEQELSASKASIEDHVGQSVVLFAPPGGRLNPRVAGIAERLGYRGICSSRAGIWSIEDGCWHIPRLAVLASTSDRQFNRWIRQDTWEYARMTARDRALSFAKQVLGNAGYERLRSRLLGKADTESLG
jgi:peptidoglycan/xylan/chitin deacetylase (PgdA/CDA1 family)